MHSKTLLVVMVGILILAGCKKEEAAPEEVRPVRTIVIGAASNVSGIALPGEVRARHETALSFRIGGKLASRLVDVGATVQPGQTLAKLDPQDMALNAEAARAQTAAATTSLNQLKLDLTRSKELFSKKFVSQAEVDRKQSDVNSAQSKLEQAQAQQRLANNQATYSVLNADVAGVITGVDAEPGQVVAAGQSVLRVARDGEREVVVDVAENQRSSLSVGQSVVVSLWALPGKSFNGKIREIAPAADALSRTYRVRATLDAQDASIRLGMSATLRVPVTQEETSVSVPMSAVFGTGGDQCVWLLDTKNQRVHRVAVKIMGFDGDNLQVNGLKQNDVVVTAGVHLLREGQRVLSASKAGA